MTYVTIASVRRTCGIASTDISDADITSIIAEVEPQLERYYNTSFTPKTKIEFQNGNGTDTLILRKNPVMAVRQLKIDGDTEDPANLHIYPGSGKIVLSSSATASTFIQKNNSIVIKYIYGFLEESSTSTTSSAAEVAGTDVSIAVGSITGFSNGDWVEIYGMDGHRESAQINAVPGAGAIQVDQLIFPHELGSTIVKLQVSKIFEKIMNVCCGIAMVMRIIGQSYTDIVGYTMGEFSVQKGEPYTQWRETASQLIKERDDLLERIKARPCIM